MFVTLHLDGAARLFNAFPSDTVYAWDPKTEVTFYRSQQINILCIWNLYTLDTEPRQKTANPLGGGLQI
jgi:hypothetical protein